VRLQTAMQGLCRAVAAGALAAASLLAAPTASYAQEVVVLVDGEPITALDIEQRMKFLQMSTPKAASRKDALDGLIDEILEIHEAKRFGVNVPDSEVDNSFAGVAAQMGADADKLKEMLTKGGASVGTFKHRLRAQVAWSTLVRGRFKNSLEIGDTDVEAALALHPSQDKAEVGYEYVLRPILFVVPRGSPDAAFEARKRDADALRTRFESCADGVPFARALREVAVRDQVTKFSADLAEALRNILNNTEVGHLTPPEQTAEGIQMFALCAKRENKTDTPGKKEARQELFDKKFGAQSKRYLAQLRRSAMIEYKVPLDQADEKNDRAASGTDAGRAGRHRP
jgi:peptidyl-prolyl cis-trans isomerase SurA